MNSRERRAAAYRAKCAAEASKDIKLSKRVAMSLSGCSGRVYKAVNALPLRSQQQASSDNRCLPDVAIFAAGHRKPTETITAR